MFDKIKNKVNQVKEDLETIDPTTITLVLIGMEVAAIVVMTAALVTMGVDLGHAYAKED